MIKIRPALPSDVVQLLAFIRALALYEREPDSVFTTEADLLRDGFGEKPFFRCLIAEMDGRSAGFALYFFTYSTWTGRPGIYLEDLFVSPEFRSQGLGKALLARIAAIAVETNCARFEWSVLDWNQPSIDFYQSLGAVFLDDWRKMRVSGDSLTALAVLAATLESETAK
jgi:GNAT superfamily N-acetyltransferase